MTRTKRCCTIALLAGALWACEEVPHPLETGPIEVPDIASPPAGLSAAEVPKEFSTPPSIQNWWTDVGFSGTVAWAQGYMRFFANHAEQLLSLTVRKDGSTVGQRTALERDSYFLPRYTSQWVTTSIDTYGSCGRTAGASTRHTAWHQLAIQSKLTQWGHTSRNSGGDASQPSCSPSCAYELFVDPEDCEDDGLSSGGGGSGDGSSGESAGGSTSDDCRTEHIVLEVDGEVVYSGPAKICE